MTRIEELQATERALVNAIAELEGRLATPGISVAEIRRIERELPRMRQDLARVRAAINAARGAEINAPSAGDHEEIQRLAQQLDGVRARNLTINGLLEAATKIAQAAHA